MMLADQQTTRDASTSFSESGDSTPQAHKINLPNRTVLDGKKLTRRRQSKVKTGCYTCKERRVKCDEGKPACNRCIKFGVDCEGYSPPYKNKPTAISRVILPKWQRPRQALQIAPIYKIHSGPRFEDEQEGRYFRLYCEKMARQIKGPFPTSLWDRVIPQIAEAEPFIRHAIVGIGALSKIIEDASKRNMHVSSPASIPDSSYALEQYGKALQGIGQTISRGEQDVKKFLVACVLIFIFETLCAKPGSAVNNAKSGLMLMMQWTQANAMEAREFSLGSEWREHQVEEDLMMALAGLDLQVLFFLDTRPESVHQYIIDCSNKIIPHFPKEFGTLISARKPWSLIMRRNFHFRKLVLMRSKSHETGGPWKYVRPYLFSKFWDKSQRASKTYIKNYTDPLQSSEAPWDDCVDIFPGGNMFSTPKDPPWEMYADSVRYREDLKRWNLATSRLFEYTQQHGTQEEKVVIALLRMHEIISHIMLAGAFFTTETEYDEFFPEFRIIMSLLEYTHPYVTATGSALYQFDLGIIIGLYLVGTRCRERETREKAIQMMLAKQFREGMWDTSPAAIICQWSMEVEEAGRDENGEIPEYKRAFVSSIFVDLAGGRGIMGLTRKGLDGPEYFEKTYTRLKL